MTITTEHLFAALVYKEAQSRRTSAAVKANALQDNQWIEENPVEKFVPDVLTGIESVATEIRRLKGGK